jgi:L-alanine-DL-glutamate epimerase-like enolase superfamily enzyme
MNVSLPTPIPGDRDTRIVKLETFLLHVPVTGGSIADSIHQLTHWGVPGVRVELADATVGWGIAGTHAHLPTDRMILAFIDQVCRPLLEHEPFDSIERLTERVYRFPPAQWVGRSGLTHIALGAVNIALWDLAAKRAAAPLWQWLRQLRGDAPTSQPALVAYNTDVGWLDRSEEQLVANAKQACEEDGFAALKIKVGRSDPAEDLRRVTAVRRAVGDDVTLMVDANGRWQLDHALSLAPRLAELDILWIEEPLWYDDVAAHAELARLGQPRVALGEQLYNRWDFANFTRAEALHVAQPDVTRLCGVTEWCAVAAEAFDAGLEVVAHAGDMGQVHLHTSYAFSQIKLFEYIPWTRHCFVDPVTVVDGRARPPEAPGAGTTIRPEALTEFGKNPR